jgi:diguanylate cyclase
MKYPGLSFNVPRLFVQINVSFLIGFILHHFLINRWIHEQYLTGWLIDLLEVFTFSLICVPILYIIVCRDLKRTKESVEHHINQYDKFKIILDESPLGAFIYDSSGFIYVSNNYHKIMGYEAKDFIGKKLAEVPIFDRETIILLENNAKNRLSQKQVPESYIVPANRRDGSKMFLEIRSKIIQMNRQPVLIGSYADMTDKIKLEASVRDSEKLYRRLFESNMDTVLIIDFDGIIIDINKASEVTIGYSRLDLIGKPYSMLVYPEDLPMVKNVFEKVLQGTTTRYEMKCINKQGEIRVLTVNAVPLYNEVENKITGLFAIAKDITEQRQHLQTIHKIAYHDSLTGLPNRYYFTQECQKTLAEAEIAVNQVALLYIDLDRVKVVNENLGYTAGDEFLKQSSALFKTALKGRGFISRIGAEEFAVVIPSYQSIEEIIVLTETLLSVLSSPLIIEQQCIRSKTSMGISLYPEHGKDFKTLLQAANTAMYQAKYEGGNQFKVYHPSFDKKIAELFQLEIDLAKAIENHELYLAYQPKVDPETYEIKGVETLVRWNHPTKGIVSPGDFIPIAEDTGLIVPLGEWVLREACRQATKWQRQGFFPFRISVNASILQFQRTNFPEKIKEVLAETGLDPWLLEIEITEGTFMEENQVVVEGVSLLKDMGVYISLDDFGTGYSSMKYLHQFRLHALKIDRAFIDQVNEHKEKAAIVQSITQLAHGLSMHVVAEGVETVAELDFIKNLGIDEVQGYYISKPLLPEQLEQFIFALEETREKQYQVG